MSKTRAEVDSQPAVWARVLSTAGRSHHLLPPPGATALYLGCGTSAFVARCLATLRDLAGQGPTDWAYASELPPRRSYDYVVALSRSATTTEILSSLAGPLAGAHKTMATAVPDLVPGGLVHQIVDISPADESSVVQTRFPTSTIMLFRELLGEDLRGVISQARQVLAQPLPVPADQFQHFVYLARGWALGLAEEAALKMRESAQAWSEAYPALDFRHGPISVAGPTSLVVSMNDLEPRLRDDIVATGATVLDQDLDPVVRLIQCQRLALELAEARGLNPDQPRHLTRSVVLPSTAGLT